MNFLAEGKKIELFQRMISLLFHSRYNGYFREQIILCTH